MSLFKYYIQSRMHEIIVTNFTLPFLLEHKSDTWLLRMQLEYSLYYICYFLVNLVFHFFLTWSADKCTRVWVTSVMTRIGIFRDTMDVASAAEVGFVAIDSPLHCQATRNGRSSMNICLKTFARQIKFQVYLYGTRSAANS